MVHRLAKSMLNAAKAIDADFEALGNIPVEGLLSRTQQVVPFSLVRGTRGYIEKVTNQINGTYEHGWFDACAVLVRRLVETLIIETYEKHGIANQIQDGNGDFLMLRDLIDRLAKEKNWNLGRAAKKALPRLKDVGDKSAHSRRFNAHKSDIDKLKDDLRVTVQELVYLAGLK
jgi:hypothetical protein